MKKLFGIGVAALTLTSMAFGRLGPVSQYGQLQAGKNANGKGQIYGSCKGVTSGNEVVVQGMSLFWSGADEGSRYWTNDIIGGLVSRQNIEVVRAPMSVDETGWSGSDHYFKSTGTFQNMMNTVVQSAIDNDIYVLIDFHSHCAENSTENAKTFFGYMAQKWGKYDNVIFEVYNEPVGSGCNKSWIKLDDAKSYWTSSIKPYAESVIAVIRQYSDNLVVVGTPYYDQYPNAALASPINDKNVAYTFHYYAGEDQYKHTVSDQGNNAVLAMNGGLSVFVTEWGNSAPSGDDGFNASYSTTWYNWMVQNKLSGANWSVTDKPETASYFASSGAWNYSTSGEWTNSNVFAKNPKSYTACSTTGSTPVSSSSVARSSSSVVSSSSSVVPASSSSMVRSSSSVVLQSSSSVVRSSSSAVASSSSVTGSATISGDLVQTVAKGETFATVTITGVTSYARNTWNIYFLDIPQQATNGTVTISGTVPEHAQEGSFEETFTVNGEAMTIKLTVTAAGAASSSSTVADSSSASAPNSSESVMNIAVANRVQLGVTLIGRSLEISGATLSLVDVFDMQGRPLKSFRNVQGSLSLESFATGNYIVKIRSGSSSRIQRISLK